LGAPGKSDELFVVQVDRILAEKGLSALLHICRSFLSNIAQDYNAPRTVFSFAPGGLIMLNCLRNGVLFAALAGPFVSVTGWAASPTSDCSKGVSEVGKLVCNSAALSVLDRQMAETYRAAQAQAKAKGADANRLTTTQRGWLKGRDDCSKAADQSQCTQSAYESRIAELQARYALVPAFRTVAFSCHGKPSSTIVATFYNGEPLPSVRLVRGKQTVYGALTRTGSGARYLADPGISFWNKGNDAMVDWPEGTQFNCSAKF
jgi:uncharacterized protein